VCCMKHDEREGAAGRAEFGSRDAGRDAATGGAACAGGRDAGGSGSELGDVSEQCRALDADVSRAGRRRTGEPQGHGPAAEVDEEATSAALPLDRREEPSAVQIPFRSVDPAADRSVDRAALRSRAAQDHDRADAWASGAHTAATRASSFRSRRGGVPPLGAGGVSGNRAVDAAAAIDAAFPRRDRGARGRPSGPDMGPAGKDPSGVCDGKARPHQRDLGHQSARPTVVPLLSRQPQRPALHRLSQGSAP